MPVEKSIIAKAVSLGQALLTGNTVDKETIRKRIEICGGCELVNVNKEGRMACGICGCKLDSENRLVNLARYVETDQYGCMYEEEEGVRKSKWKEAGV